MPDIERPSLRTLLAVDALTCAAMGAALLLASAPIAALTDIPQALLFYAGVSLVPIAAFMAAAARRPVVARWALWSIVGGNVLWVAASALLLMGGLIAPNALGWLFVAGQATVVALLAKLELDAAGASGAVPCPAPNTPLEGKRP